MVFAKGNPLVWLLVNRALAAMKRSGQLQKIQQQWLAKATGAPVLERRRRSPQLEPSSAVGGRATGGAASLDRCFLSTVVFFTVLAVGDHAVAGLAGGEEHVLQLVPVPRTSSAGSLMPSSSTREDLLASPRY